MLQHLRTKVTTNGTSCEAYWTCEQAHRLATNLLPVCTSYVQATDSQPRTSACERIYPIRPSWLSTTLGKRSRRAFGVVALLVAPPPALPSCARLPCQFPAGLQPVPSVCSQMCECMCQRMCQLCLVGRRAGGQTGREDSSFRRTSLAPRSRS